MTDDLTRLKALEERLRSTTQEMATTCGVPMELWDRHSNAVLEAADALSSARAEGWKAGRDAAAKVVLNHYIGPATSRAANYREANVTRPVLATAILALEEPPHE